MARARKFERKIYCSNCGKWILTVKAETKEHAAFHKIEATFNHETCGTPGSGTRTFGYHDINPKNDKELDAKVASAMQIRVQNQ